MKNNKIKNLIFCISTCCALSIFTACDNVLSNSSSNNLPTVETAIAKICDIDETITVSGFVEAETSTEIKSEINGRIIRILVDNGHQVKKNDLLMEIDPKTYQTEVDAADRAVRQRQLDLEKSERDMKRIKELYENDFASEQAYLDSVTVRDNNALQLEVAQATLSKMSEELSKTQIRAPHDGVISDLDVYVGNVISGAGSFSSGTLLMKVNDMTKMRVEADLNEIEANKIDLNSEATLTFDSLPKVSFKGKVNYLSPFGVQDSSTKTLYKFPVRVNFNTGKMTIRPGISSNIKLLVARVKNVIAVPASAVFIENNTRFVFIKKGTSSYERIPITIGIGNLNEIEIKKGVAVNDIVATTRPSASEIINDDKNQSPASSKKMPPHSQK